MLGLNSANKTDAIYAALAFRSYGGPPTWRSNCIRNEETNMTPIPDTSPLSKAQQTSSPNLRPWQERTDWATQPDPFQCCAVCLRFSCFEGRIAMLSLSLKIWTQQERSGRLS